MFAGFASREEARTRCCLFLGAEKPALCCDLNSITNVKFTKSRGQELHITHVDEERFGVGAWACKICYNKWMKGEGKKRRKSKGTVRGEKGDGVDVEEAEEEAMEDVARTNMMNVEGEGMAPVLEGLNPPPAPTPPPESQPPPVPPRGRLQPSPFWNWVGLQATAFDVEPVVGEAEVAPPQPNPQETYRLRAPIFHMDDRDLKLEHQESIIKEQWVSIASLGEERDEVRVAVLELHLIVSDRDSECMLIASLIRRMPDPSTRPKNSQARRSSGPKPRLGASQRARRRKRQNPPSRPRRSSGPKPRLGASQRAWRPKRRDPPSRPRRCSAPMPSVSY